MKGRRMPHPELTGQRLVASCFLGWLLFTYPLLALFDGAGMLLGIPSMVAYLFGAWAFVIALLALLAREGTQGRDDPPAAPPPDARP
jgi:Na+/proline symporter